MTVLACVGVGVGVSVGVVDYEMMWLRSYGMMW